MTIHSTLLCLLTLFASLCLPSSLFAQWPASGEPVIVTRANGFAIQGRVTSMNERGIRFRSTQGVMMSFRGKELRGVQTKDDTYTWDGSQNRFVSARAAAERAQAETARKKKQLDEAAAKSGGEKLKGTWCGFMRHLPAGAVTSGIAHQSRFQHSLCVMYIDKVNGSKASGTLVIPEHKYKASISLTCKPLSDNRREKDMQKFFDVDCSLSTNVPLPSGSVGVKSFPLGFACRTYDGLLPVGLTLDLKSVPPEDTFTKKAALTALALTRQDDIQHGQPGISIPLTMANAVLDFQQGKYHRTTSELYDTSKVLRYDPNLLGPGFHPVHEKEWRPVTERQHMPHVRFAGEISNPTSQSYDVTIVCFFHVDNEAFYSGNVPHRGVFTIRVPASKSVKFGEGYKLRNLAEEAWKGMGLLGTFILGGQALTPQSDNNWHVAHVTKVTAAIVSATPVSSSK